MFIYAHSELTFVCESDKGIVNGGMGFMPFFFGYGEMGFMTKGIVNRQRF